VRTVWPGRSTLMGYKKPQSQMKTKHITGLGNAGLLI